MESIGRTVLYVNHEYYNLPFSSQREHLFERVFPRRNVQQGRSFSINWPGRIVLWIHWCLLYFCCWWPYSYPFTTYRTCLHALDAKIHVGYHSLAVFNYKVTALPVPHEHFYIAGYFSKFSWRKPVKTICPVIETGINVVSAIFERTYRAGYFTFITVTTQFEITKRIRL